ncbi:MAG: hypothetical protein KC731_41855, partial [Myxococcales bacterium]|nr:hypothetical protein [Myxococcales bacterium]
MTAGFTVQTGPTVAQACSLAKVSQLVGRTATFVLRYPVEPAGAELSHIGSRALDPDEEITVIDGDGGTVIRGFVQRQRAHIEHGPVRSWVEVAGADPTLAMGRQSRCDHHTGTVQSILEDVIGRYFEQKHVAPIQHEHLADDNELIQSVDDLAFVRSVAAQHGHLFDVGYRDSEQARIWQPVLTGDVAATIRINDNDNNVDAIELAWDVERPDTIEAELVSFADKEVWGRPEPGAQPAAPSTTDPGRTTLSAAGRPRTRRVIVPADTAEHLR